MNNLQERVTQAYAELIAVTKEYRRAGIKRIELEYEYGVQKAWLIAEEKIVGKNQQERDASEKFWLKDKTQELHNLRLEEAELAYLREVAQLEVDCVSKELRIWELRNED